MPDRLERTARRALVLVLCTLAALLPSRGLHVNLCACNGLVTGDVCPCDESTPCTSASCCDESRSCCDSREAGDDETPCGDGCCHSIGIDEFSPPWDGRPEFVGDDLGDDVAYAEPPAGVEFARAAKSIGVHATGPPSAHRLRRMLLEHASVVLLI